MTERLIAVHFNGVLVYSVRKAAFNEAGEPVAVTTMATATMPDANIAAPQCKALLKDAKGRSLAAGVIGFYVGEADIAVAPANGTDKKSARA